MSTHLLVIPQAPTIRVEPRGTEFVARLVLVEVVTEPCALESTAVMAALTARKSALQQAEEIAALVRSAAEVEGE